MSCNNPDNSSSPSSSSSEKERYSGILKQNGIHNKIHSVDIVHPDLAGDHFASTCYCVTIHFEEEENNEEGKKKPPLELFVKKSVKDAEYGALLRDLMMFEKEAQFFNNIVKEMQEFCTKKLGSSEFIDELIPKCYYADNDFIAMENLVKKGFFMKDKKETHTFLRARKVMEQLAKFHAVSYCLLKEVTVEKVLEKYPYLDKNHLWTAEGEPLQGPWIHALLEPALTILNDNPTRGSEKVVEYLNNKKNPPGPYLQLCPSWELKSDSCANVLSHGDLWSSNMLFKDNEETGEVEKCMFIDLQSIHIGSMVLDLQYYMHLAVFYPLRSEYWKKLLRIYYENFKTSVEQFGLQIDFSFETMVNEYRQKCESGFMISLYLIFGWDCLDNLGDLDKIEGSVIEHISKIIKEFGLKFANSRGPQLSKRIVTEFEHYQKLISERD